MILRSYKFVVQPVNQHLDEQGNVIGENVGPTSEVFGCDGLAEWAALFDERLQEEVSRAANAG